MGELLICMMIGYLLGCINPAYLISKMKDKDITNQGNGESRNHRYFYKFWKSIWGAGADLRHRKAALAVVVNRYLYPDFF